MPIEGMASRLNEIGRIRIGVFLEDEDRPEKLETFRLTSSDLEALNAAAKLYGGTVGEKSKVGYDLITETDRLFVMVPPNALSQYYELWSAGGLKRRCDGVNELTKDAPRPCLCEAEENRTCVPRSMLRLVMPQIPGLGVWTLATQGWNAAHELKGSVEMLEQVAHRGESPVAELVLEQRQRKVPGEGTRKFAVPVLRIPYSLAELGAPENRSIVRVDTATGEINPTEPPSLGALAAVAGSHLDAASDTSPEGTTGSDRGSNPDPAGDESRAGEPARPRAPGAEPARDTTSGGGSSSRRSARRASSKREAATAPVTEPPPPARCPTAHSRGVDIDGNCLDCGAKMTEALFPE